MRIQKQQPDNALKNPQVDKRAGGWTIELYYTVHSVKRRKRGWRCVRQPGALFSEHTLTLSNTICHNNNSLVNFDAKKCSLAWRQPRLLAPATWQSLDRRCLIRMWRLLALSFSTSEYSWHMHEPVSRKITWKWWFSLNNLVAALKVWCLFSKGSWFSFSGHRVTWLEVENESQTGFGGKCGVLFKIQFTGLIHAN